MSLTKKHDEIIAEAMRALLQHEGVEGVAVIVVSDDGTFRIGTSTPNAPAWAVVMRESARQLDTGENVRAVPLSRSRSRGN